MMWAANERSSSGGRPEANSLASSGAIDLEKQETMNNRTSVSSNASSAPPFLTFEPDFSGLDGHCATKVNLLTLERAKVFPKSDVGVTATVRLGQTLGIFGGTKLGRNRIINAFAGNIASCRHSFLARKKQTVFKDVASSLTFGFVARSGHLFFPYATLLEDLTFSLRLSNKRISAKAAEERALTLLETLGLAHHKATVFKSLSCLEKKLFSIASELVFNPDVLCIEDAFESLSASTDWFALAKALSGLAASKRCLVVYSASTCDAILYDQAHDILVLDKTTNAVVLSASRDMLGGYSAGGLSPVDQILFQLKKVALKVNEISETIGSIERAPSSVFDDEALAPKPKVEKMGMVETFWELLKREFIFTKRDPSLFVGRMISAAASFTIMALLFMHVADQTRGLKYSPVSHSASVVVLLFLGASSAIVSASTNVAATKLAMLRQCKAGLYSPAVYHAVRLIPEILVNVIVTFFSLLITYWSVQWYADFFYIFAVLFLFIETTMSYAYVVGTFTDSTGTAVIGALAALVPQFLFSGSFVRISAMPVFIKWINYTCSFTWAIRTLLVEELDLTKCINQTYCLQWAASLSAMLAEKRDAWQYFTILVTCFWIAPRLIAVIAAYYRGHSWRTNGVQ